MSIPRAGWLTLVTAITFVFTASEVSLGQNFTPQGWGYAAPLPAQAMSAGQITPVAQPGWGYAAPTNYSDGSMPTDGASAYYEEAIPEDGNLTGVSRGHHLGAIGYALRFLAPYNEGTPCTPHWFDVEAEAVFLSLDNRSSYFELTRDTSNQLLISSNDLDPDLEPGLRITGAVQVGAGSNLELTYLGLFDHTQTKIAYGDDNLNSIFSEYTTLAPPDGLEQFDLADWQEAVFGNNLDSLELNYRRHWMGPSCLLQGSWLVGIRYVKLEELLRFTSIASRDTNNDNLDDTGGVGHYLLQTNNYMTGFQAGGDAWVCFLPGLNLGVEGKGGIYGNNAKQWTEMWSVDLVDNYTGIIPPEQLRKATTSFVGELNFMLNYRLNPKWTVRAGYEMLWVANTSLVSRNFNPDTDMLTSPNGRVPFINNNGTAFYHGFTIGAEWMW